ncbi:MAG: hypothetical protein AAF830_13670 [Pseudomonadota bacterium]
MNLYVWDTKDQSRSFRPTVQALRDAIELESDKVITYGGNEGMSSNSMNEWLAVEHDDLSAYLRAGGMSSVFGGSREVKLTQQGAAEMFWDLMLDPVRPRES